MKNELDLGTSLDQVTSWLDDEARREQWIKDQESVPWCNKCGDRPAVEPYDELLCDQCNSQIYRLFLTDDEADS